MEKKEQRNLVKQLIEKKKAFKDKSVIIEKTTILSRPRVNKKYVSDSNYKELLVLYDFMKDNSDLCISEIENLIEHNALSFPFLKKCYDSIYDFVSYLKCNGPYYVAKEMSRQGKEIEYINNNILKSDRKDEQ